MHMPVHRQDLGLPLVPPQRLALTSLALALAACGADRAPTALATDAGNDTRAACDPGVPVPLPVTATRIVGPPGSEDFTFDREGYLVALSSGHTLVRVARGGPPIPVAPNVVVNGRGLRMLPGGAFLIADRDRSLIVRLDPGGATRRLTTTIPSPNGLELGPGGDLFVTDFGTGGEVYRVHPDSGATSVVASPGEGSNGLAFSPDHRWLYVGDHDRGVIQRLALAADGSAGAPEIWARDLGRPDGLLADACGNVYAAGWDARLYRASPAGKVEVVARFTGPVSAVHFGSGQQGWQAENLYVMAIQEGGVWEVPIGRTTAAPP